MGPENSGCSIQHTDRSATLTHSLVREPAYATSVVDRRLDLPRYITLERNLNWDSSRMFRTSSRTLLSTRSKAYAITPSVYKRNLGGLLSTSNTSTHPHTSHRLYFRKAMSTTSIPKVQTAAVVESIGASIDIRHNHPVKQASELAPGECLIKLSHSGVCHTDLHAKQGDWPVKPNNPLIGGHEGVGEVVAIGANTAHSPVKLGDRVGIKWLANSCLNCEFCRKGFEQNCVNAQLSGYTVDGTFSQYVVSYVQHVTPIPKELDSAGAASILCAGVTVYRAIKCSHTKIGDWVVIPGAGGGLGHLAVQYAVAMGLRVVGIDTGAEKKELVLSLGAEKWIDFKETKDLVKDVKDATDGLGPHAAIVAAAHASAYEQAVDYLRPTGTLVVVGLPNEKLGANIFWTVFKSIKIEGSYVGNRQDAIEALDIAAAGKVKVHFKLGKLADLKDVYEGMEKGEIVGRVVLSMDN